MFSDAILKLSSRIVAQIYTSDIPKELSLLDIDLPQPVLFLVAFPPGGFLVLQQILHSPEECTWDLLN